MKSSLTIKSRLFFSIAAILACSYAILFFVSVVTLQRFLEEQTAKDLQFSLKFAKDQFSARQEMVLEALKLPLSTPLVQQLFKKRDYKAIQDSAKIWTNSLDFLEMLTIVDARQKLIARSNGHNHTETFLGSELLNTVFERKQAIIATELVPHDEYCVEISSHSCQALHEKSDVMVQLVLVPLLDHEENILGAIIAGADVNKDSYLPYQQQKVFGKTVEMLVTQLGEQIASTMKDSGGLASALEPRVLDSLKNGYTFQGTAQLNGVLYDMIAEPINNHKSEFIGSVAVALPVDRFATLHNENYRNLLLCGFFSSLLILGFAFFAARQFTLPIRRVTDALKSIESGDYSIQVTESGSAEFRALSEAFNRVAVSMGKNSFLTANQLEELRFINNELETVLSVKCLELATETALHKSMVRSLADGLIVMDENFNITEINSSAGKLLEINSSVPIGSKLSILFERPGLNELEILVKSAVANNFQGNETGLLLMHNRKRLKCFLADLQDDLGSPKGFMLSIRDVTTDGEIERLKSGFIAKVSHELKTPLTSMKGSLQFILKKGKWLTGVEREMLAICLRNTERLIGLVTGIIELSRIEAGQIIFSLKPVQIGEVVLYAIEEFKGAALVKNISIVNDIPMDLPKVNGDYDRLTQVLSNLLSNAVKFSPENSVVTLSALTRESFLEISVADDGKVIAEEERGALFSTFQQMGRPEDGEHSGSGLGLAICREILDMHGGAIAYTPGVSGGNVFTIKVPLYGEADGKQ